MDNRVIGESWLETVVTVGKAMLCVMAAVVAIPLAALFVWYW